MSKFIPENQVPPSPTKNHALFNISNQKGRLDGTSGRFQRTINNTAAEIIQIPARENMGQFLQGFIRISGI